MGMLSAIVEDARQRYLKSSRPHVIVHTIKNAIYSPGSVWNNAKQKSHRPLSSIILREGVINSPLEDAREFIRMEDWYKKVDIPHQRGYLLYGLPGTGKSLTIYAIASELGLEIYCLSLAATFVDDSFLARVVATIPKQAIFLLEDIDCAFPPCDEDHDGASPAAFSQMQQHNYPGRQRGSSVTLSGLLNTLDGVGSEEGKIFFAMTKHIDRLDPVLLHLGRIDNKIEYKLATKAQIAALFLRFYPEAYTTLRSEGPAESGEGKAMTANVLTPSEKQVSLRSLSEDFAALVPDHVFSTAEVQGFLLGYKQQPEHTLENVGMWVKEEQRERAQKYQRLQALKDRRMDVVQMGEAKRLQRRLAPLGVSIGGLDGPSRSVLETSLSKPPDQAPLELESKSSMLTDS